MPLQARLTHPRHPIWGALLCLAALAALLAACGPLAPAAVLVPPLVEAAGAATATPSAATALTLPMASPTAPPLPATHQAVASQAASVDPIATTATSLPAAAASAVSSTAAPAGVDQPAPAASAEPADIPTPTTMPGPTPDAQAAGRAVRLPILMYHYVEPWPAGAGDMRQGLTVRPEAFAAQMAYLHDQGYVSVSLYELVYALALGWPLPERAFVLTFDDGYRSLADYAVPVMESYDYTGTIFVITQLIDEGFPQYLTWQQAESLYARGWKIEPHTKTHEQLSGRDRDFQLYQMLGSLQTVQAHIGTQPRFFAYPSGRHDDLTIEMARAMNFWGAVTVDAGSTHRLETAYTLTRVRVSGLTTLPDFISAIQRP